MKLTEAEKIADEVLGKICQHFQDWCVCGSIRRERPQVNDIDIVAIPKSESEYKFGDTTLGQSIVLLDPTGHAEASELGKKAASRFLDGGSIKRFQYKGIIIDLYLATKKTFGTLCLIRTGSKEHNIKLTTLARGKGMKLFANGTGLCHMDAQDNIINIVTDTEDGILMNLLNHVPQPKNREA